MALPTPSHNAGPQQQQLFQSELRLILKVDLEGASHPLIRLNYLLPRENLEQEFRGEIFETGRPRIPA